MSSVLLGLWMALVAGDRIDLAGGHGAFTLTPFILLTPLVVASELMRRHRLRSPVRLTRSAVVYACLAGALVSTCMLSVFAGLDSSIGASRAMLLVADVAGTLAVVLLSADRPNVGPIFARAAVAWVALSVAFNIGESLYWIGAGPESLRLGPVSLAFGDLQNVGPLPRLAGATGDANHTGYMLLCDMILISRWERRPWLRRVALGAAALLFVATFSRSAILAGVAALVVTAIQSRGVDPRLLAGALGAIALAAIVGLAAPRTVNRAIDVAQLTVAERFSVAGGSAQGHLDLLERGVSEGTASIKRSMIGIGYGNSYLVLQDIFPGNRYGNFHSLFVSAFAESGVFALVLVVILLGVPLAVSESWRGIMAASVAFNLFYQSTTAPMFWLMLAIAWLTISRPRQRWVADT